MRGPVVNFGDPRLPDRFWSKVQPCPMSGCWIWTACSHNGYARFGQGGRKTGGVVGGHQHAYKKLVGEVPSGFHLDHLCRVRCCVNPLHLEPVTRKENILRGSGFSARHARVRNCPAGHEYAGDNLYIYKGSRHCRACLRARATVRREAVRRAKQEAVAC